MRIEHVALNVPDPVAMADWYCRHLGMRVVRAADGPTHTRFLADDSGRTVIELYHQSKAPIPDYFAQDPMVLHIAFVAEDVTQTCERLVKAGAKAAGEPLRTPIGDLLAMLHDPWGVAIQFVHRARPLID